METREEVQRLAAALADEEGLDLVDVEILVQGGRRVVRVSLDRPGGIRLSDCARFSRRLSDCLDMNQTVLGRYNLEVSSPGIDRPLRSLDAMKQYSGLRTKLTSVEPREGRRNYEGELLEPRAGQAGIRTDDGHEHWFDWTDVKTAHLVVDPWAGVRRGGRPR